MDLFDVEADEVRYGRDRVAASSRDEAAAAGGAASSLWGQMRARPCDEGRSVEPRHANPEGFSPFAQIGASLIKAW